MLTLPEKILFAIATLVSLYFTYRGVDRIIKMISSGQGKPDWKAAFKRIPQVFAKVISFQPVFRFRLWTSILHALIGWGFLVFLVVNLSDLILGYTGFSILNQTGLFGDVFRWVADIANVAILAGMLAMIIRRFILRPATLSTRNTTLLNTKARFGISRNSAIVATFIIVHNASRYLGESFSVALSGSSDKWQPTISAVAGLWSGMSTNALVIGEHAMFWLSLGAVVAFLPYFPYSKHIHLFFAPLNIWMKPQRRSIGELNYINIDDPVHRAIRRGPHQRSGLGAGNGFLCLHHVLPLSGSVPGV